MKNSRQLGAGAPLALLGAFAAYLLALHLLEPSPEGFLAVTQPEAAQPLVNTLARTSVTLISALFASLFLAIPLTASMYTPQLIELFVRSWTNRIVLGLFIFSAGHAVWLSRLASPDFVPRTNILISLGLVTLSLAVLLPYLFSVFRFLDPDTIISRVADTVVREMRAAAGGDVSVRQQALSRRIAQLGNIVLRSVDRADRDVALRAVEALEGCAGAYRETKRFHSPEWFSIGSAHFPGLSREAVALVNRGRVWVELEVLRQLGRAYDAALAKVPDVLGAISRTIRHIALQASSAGDREALEVNLRCFNNFLREAVKKKDQHALYDVLYQYRLVAEVLWEKHPGRAGVIARHLDYYGRAAAQAGIPFAQDLVAYDLGALISHAVQADRAARRDPKELDDLLSVFLALERPASPSGQPGVSAGMIKARILLAARLERLDHHLRAGRIEASFSALHAGALRSAGADLREGSEESFWEATDRQQNLDYVEPSLRDFVEAILSRLEENR